MLDKLIVIFILLPTSLFLSFVMFMSLKTLWYGPLTDADGAFYVILMCVSGLGSFLTFNASMIELFGKNVS
jgi:hypothetical protein